MPLQPKRLLKVLLASSALLAVAGVLVVMNRYFWGHAYLLGLNELFDLGTDSSIPTWYASLSLLLCSILLAIIFQEKQKQHDSFALHWLGLSLMFLVFSADEVARIHETVGDEVVSRVFGETRGYFRFPWVIAAIPIVALVAVTYLKFFKSLPSNIRKLLIVGALTYFGGAILMEMLNARIYDLHGGDNIQYQLQTVVEEVLEMLGVAVFAYGVSTYLTTSVGHGVWQPVAPATNRQAANNQ